MSLAQGTRIGPYEVVTSLGAGGMGEVYRARDTRLKRDVALKILPDSFASDPDRLARFQREAEVLGALNHPLIAHIYGMASASTALYALSDQVLAAERSQSTGAPNTKAVGAALEIGMTSERRRLMRRVVMPLAIVAGFTFLVAAYALWSRPAAEAPMALRLAIAVPGGEGVPSGRRVVAISPDGRHIAYVSNLRMFVRSLSEFDFRELLSNNAALGMNMPVFSPDSGSLGFFGTGFIRRVSLAGGAATTVCAVDPPFGVSWDETGLVIGQGSNGIVRCPAHGGEPERLVTANAGEELQGPQLLPGGKTILYTVAKTSEGRGRWDNAQIVVQSLIGGDRRVIISGGSDARYLPTGHIVYALSGVMLAAPFDLQRLEIAGPAAPVIEGVTRTLTGVTGTAQYDVAANGTLVYLPGPARMTRDRAIAVVTREGTPTRYNIPVGPYEQVRASPDGTRLAIGSDDGQEAIVWIYSLESGGALQRLTVTGRNASPIWSPDGRWLAVQSNREKDQAIYRMRVDGTGVERLTRPGAGEIHTPESWSPDGRTIAFSIEKGGRYVLSQLAVDTRAVTPLGGVDSAEPTNSLFSPDGKWIAYTIGVPGAARGPNRGVYVQPFPPTGAIYQLPQRGLDFHPVWTRDGGEIVWVPSASVAQHAVVALSTKGGFTFGSPTAFPARVTGRQTSGQRRLYDILPDGRLVGAVDPSDPLSATGAMYSEIRVVLNWLEELKQRVPTR
jgi:Tol biopolymer transport system component